MQVMHRSHGIAKDGSHHPESASSNTTVGSIHVLLLQPDHGNVLCVNRSWFGNRIWESGVLIIDPPAGSISG